MNNRVTHKSAGVTLATFFTNKYACPVKQDILCVASCKSTEPPIIMVPIAEAIYSYFKADTTPLNEQIMMLEQVIEQAHGKSKPATSEKQQ